MDGLKRVSQRRNDVLGRPGWERLESLLANGYRGRGYQVKEVGTGAIGARVGARIDLKLRKHDGDILLQCAHWNPMKVTRNAMHELPGIMVKQGATGV